MELGTEGEAPPDGACGAVEVLRGTTGDQGEGNALCSRLVSPCPWLQGQGAGSLRSPSSATRSGPWAGSSLGGLFATQGSPPAPLQGGFGLLGPALGDGHRAGVTSGCWPRPLLAWGPRCFPWWVHRGGWDPLQHPQLREEPPLSAPCALRLAASWMLMGRLSLSGRGERRGGVPGVCWAAGAGAKCLVMGSPDLGTCPRVLGTLEPRPRLRHARDTGTRPRPRPRGSVPPLVSAPLLPSRRLVGAG